MGLLGTAAMRFIRTKWKTTQSLAEELFATFGGPLDIEPQSIVINQSPGATIPPIVINQPAGTTTPGIQINNGGVVTNLGGSGGPGGGGGGGGGIDFGDITFPEQDPADTVLATPGPNENPIVLHGRVTGKVGGQAYKVRCWAKDPNTAPPIGILTVIFPDVSEDDTIPVGARTPVVAFPGVDGTTRTIVTARGYVPVWFEE